ncbi:DsbA family protein [Nocardiopsis changdeensis]|uniref:Thioredoxin domain-containing protein n=1 Tax=Nocardiopsis changdeensis TaxID=2831969 RepID=A0ABX8BTG1_9ACTN|nr:MULTISPECIES: thioredoxin domain-containing protein [Nocardiopsis]QUX25302.1 thioredoxin domain-containing protein [Nocardiopsis changdeensis]QYX35689.1 DsbA family protein [Nocardiopsis sp. MT53]
MNQNTTFTLVMLTVLGLLVGTLVYLSNRPQDSPGSAGASAAAPGGQASPSPAPAELLVREDSRYLDRVEGAPVTVVEFLDFECEACRAQFPVMERIREDYEGRIDFVVRYFPLPGHTNSEPAAAAVEAAARQGALEEMYALMYETQAEWGESQEDRSEVFVGFAEELGLDVGEFTADMESQEVADRVRADFDDGVALGVQGTPTIFVNGYRTPSMPTYEMLASLIDAGLAE